jgi:TRAP-type C4-dicarboxylate transport system permease small subunit
MNKLLIGFYKLLMFLAALAMIGTLACIVLGIGARMFKWDLTGLDAYAGYCIAAALFLALPETFRTGEHIRVNLILERMSQPVRNAMEVWCLVAGAALAGFIAYYSARLVWVSRSLHDVSQGPDATPLWIPQIAVALGALGFAVALLHALVSHVRGTAFFTTSGDQARSE